MNLVGLDIGTTGCKVSIFNDTGELLTSASREYAVSIPYPDWAEQDAEGVWQLAQAAMREALARTGAKSVGAIGLSCQGEAVIPVDRDGTALRPAILGMDSRTVAQNAWLRETFGAEHLFERTGMPIHTVNTLPKLLWLKVHEPDIWKSAARFLLYEDFIIHKMTGQAVISRCLASRTQFYDLPDDGWSGEILEKIGLDVSRLAAVQPSGTAVGTMKAELAASLGFAAPPLIVTGGHDQACGALGVGLVRPGLAMVSTGTAEVMEVALATPAFNKTLYDGNISVYAHTAPGLYLAMTLNHSGGLLLRWFRDGFCEPEKQLAASGGGDAYDLILKDASPEPTSLLVLPHFAGSGTPMFDTASRGAILGLTFASDRKTIAKAILEGLTFELRVNSDLLVEGGIEISELRAIGGGAKSELWAQLKADITGIPVVVPRVTEAAGWGAALLAGVGAGCFADVVTASENTLKLEKRFTPDPERRARYEIQYQRYRQVYPAIKALSHALAQDSAIMH